MRRFAIRTYGCQMNVHDSQKVANLLHHAGYGAADAEADADLLIINTCSIRDKAEQRLYSDLGVLRSWKQERPGRVLGVGGCVAQQVGDGILARFPEVDFVFGTHNLRWVPALSDAAGASGQRRSLTDETRSLDRFDLPDRHPAYEGQNPARAFVTVMEGCDMFCSFCIVPSTRGREISRPAAGILDEVRQLADRGVSEITLLGQTVNAYGRHDVRRGQSQRQGTLPFAELLARIDAVPGLERIRYTSPHPIFFDADLIAAHGSLRRLCPHVHLPLQSGSDSLLEAMRRRYDRQAFLEVVEGLRAARPDLALTTDVIVGFPGETPADFEATLEVMETAAFVDAYSFKFSPRPGTSALELGDPVPAEVAQERLQRLLVRQRARTLAYHRSRVGTRTQILVEGESAKARAGGRPQVSGRDPYHRVVNLDVSTPAEGPALRPGDWIAAEIVEATPHSLIGVRQAPLEAKNPLSRLEISGLSATQR